MLAIAFVDGKTVPANLSLAQIQVLLPQGIAGLRSVPEGEPVFPSETGTLHLVPQKCYTLQPTVLMTPASMASPKARTGGVGSVRPEVIQRPPAVGSFSQSPDSSPRARGDHSNTHSLPHARGSNPSTALSAHNSSEAMAPYTPLEGGPLVCFDTVTDDETSNPPPPHPTLQFQRVSLTRSYEPRQGKLILDRVHEHLMLPMLVFDIMDTPEFQRLRGLKQLGTTSYLYPGATHTRFEHSIGVAHLAGLMAKKIARRQPELGITDEDVLCVTVAGLCHDLGHGPFSHLFEMIVNRARDPRNFWHHESMSVQLLRRILARLPLANYNLDDSDANFIALCINGLRPHAPWPNNVGRPKEKRFLVDIVSNKRSGIDVDKLDYFMRDSLCCYGRTAVDCHIPRLLSACKVLCFESEYQICYEEKLALSLGDIFTLRAKLHKYAYQHRIVKVMDHMISDVLRAADPYFLVRGKNGKPTRISDCVDDEDAFIQLGDWIIDGMSASTDPRLADAQAILQRIKDRDLYTVVGMAMFARHQHRTSSHIIKDEILQYIVDDDVYKRVEAAMIVDFVKITYGSSDSEGNPDDPINNVTFYNPKSTCDIAFKLPRARQSPLFSPSEFGEKSVIVICRERELSGTLAFAFQRWREAHTRNLGVEVPVYNLSPGRVGSRAAKRARDEVKPMDHRSLGKPVLLNLGGTTHLEQQVGIDAPMVVGEGNHGNEMVGDMADRTASVGDNSSSQ